MEHYNDYYWVPALAFPIGLLLGFGYIVVWDCPEELKFLRFWSRK